VTKATRLIKETTLKGALKGQGRFIVLSLIQRAHLWARN